MAESKSRYGIIEELAERKNRFLQDIAEMEQNLRQRDFDHKRAGEDLALQKETIAASIVLTKNQIKNTDEAISSLKEISKESKTEN